MTIQSILFYAFSAILLLSATQVVSARNPVHAVLFLILCFFNAAGLFLLMGAEFVAFIMIIVYVGAVAVLFLFVVMMLDINFTDARKAMRRNLLVGLGVGGVLLAELLFVIGAWKFDNKAIGATPADAIDNTRAIGRVLYTDFFYPFQVSGLVLLVAMIGAIVLTLRHRTGTRRQVVSQQLNRPASEIMSVVKVESGKGI